MATSVTIVGASLAGVRAADALRREGFGGPVTIVGDEPHLPYDRPPLSKQLLAGAWTPEQVVLRQVEGLEIEWLLGRRAIGLDLGSRTLLLDGSDKRRFDALLIATGASPRSLPDTPALRGTFLLRTLSDSLALSHALGAARRVVVIGAGFIGSEVASTARGRGLDVTILEALPAPLLGALGERMGSVLGRLHGANGVDLRCGVGVAGLEGDRAGAVQRVRLADGSTVPADVVVVGIGVAPTTGWLEGSGVAIDNGVVCDEWCRVLDGDGRVVPDVVAAGDVASWPSRRFATRLRIEHWTNAVEQGAFAAHTLLAGGGEGHDPYDPVPYFWSDQYGHKIQFVGHSSADDDVVVVDGDLEGDRFVALYGRGGRVVGALGLGSPAKVMAWRTRIAEGAAFPPVRGEMAR